MNPENVEAEFKRALEALEAARVLEHDVEATQSEAVKLL